MGNISRRDFLKKSSGLALAATAPGNVSSAIATKPQIKFPTHPRQRISVASYPFRNFIEGRHNAGPAGMQPLMKINDFGAMVVQKFNINNIEPWSAHFKSTDPAYVAELRAACEKAGAHVVNIPADIKHSVYDPDSAMRSIAIQEGKAWVDVAVTLGSPSVRIHMAGVRDVKPDVDRAAESLRQIADYGTGKNVVVNLENDDLVSEDAFFVVSVIEKANHPYLHALPDFANSMMALNADFNYRAVTAMFKHAYNISHVKDGEDGPNGKFIPVDVGRTFSIARAAGYPGYFSMEMDRQGDPYAGTQNLIDMTLKYLA